MLPLELKYVFSSQPPPCAACCESNQGLAHARQELCYQHVSLAPHPQFIFYFLKNLFWEVISIFFFPKEFYLVFIEVIFFSSDLLC